MKKKLSKGITTDAGPADTNNYQIPDNVVKIQDGDKGFALVKKNFHRWIRTFKSFDDWNSEK